jgi:hypothetical protein
MWQHGERIPVPTTKGGIVSTVTITTAPLPGAGATSTEQTQAHAAWEASWILAQDVVDFGSPADASEAGRLAVRENAEALRRLRDH